MADKGKRGAAANVPAKVANGTTTSNTEGKKFTSTLRRLVNELDNHVKDSNGALDYGEALSGQAHWKQEAARLSEELAKRSRQFEDLQKGINAAKAENAALSNVFGERYEEWRAQTSEHEALVAKASDLQKNLDAARRANSKHQAVSRKNTELEEMLKSRERTINDLQIECEELALKTTRLRSGLERATAHAQEATLQLGIQVLDIAALPQKFEKLANDFHDLVWKYMGRDLPLPQAEKEVQCANQQIPHVASNSPAAKAMRCAVAESLVADELSNRIFASFYVPGDAPDDVHGVAEVVSWLEEVGHAVEARIIRCQLAQALSSSRDDISRRPELAAHEIRRALGPWLSDNQNLGNQLESELAGKFSEALELWEPLQRAEEQFWICDELSQLEGGGLQRQRYDEVGDVSAHSPWGSTTPLPPPIGLLFPQILAGDSIFFYGFALCSMQPAVRAAYEEGAKRARHPRRRSTGHSRKDETSTRRSRRVSGSYKDETQLRGSIQVQGAPSDASSSRRPSSHVRPEITASVSSTRSRGSERVANGS